MTDPKATASRRTDRLTNSGGTVRWGDGGPFAVVPGWVLDSSISDRAKVLYANLAARAGAEGATLRGHIEMEAWLRCKRTAVKEALRELADLGAITVYDTVTDLGGRGRNEYVVHAIDPSREGDGGSRRGDDLLPLGDPELLEEGTTSPSSGVAVAAVPGGGDTPWKASRVGGRDLAFDALREVCHIHPDSPRMREIPSALNGGGKGRTPGIRALAWLEAPPDARADPLAWETWLAAEIPRRAEAYRARLSGAAITPQALAKWWVDVRAAPVSASASAFEVAQDEIRRMEEGR